METDIKDNNNTNPHGLPFMQLGGEYPRVQLQAPVAVSQMSSQWALQLWAQSFPYCPLEHSVQIVVHGFSLSLSHRLEITVPVGWALNTNN